MATNKYANSKHAIIEAMIVSMLLLQLLAKADIQAA